MYTKDRYCQHPNVVVSGSWLYSLVGVTHGGFMKGVPPPSMSNPISHPSTSSNPKPETYTSSAAITRHSSTSRKVDWHTLLLFLSTGRSCQTGGSVEHLTARKWLSVGSMARMGTTDTTGALDTNVKLNSQRSFDNRHHDEVSRRREGTSRSFLSLVV